MTSPGPAFSLSYDLSQADLADFYANLSGRRRRRRQAAALSVGYGLLGGVLTAFTVALDVPHEALGSTSAPGWMYTVDLAFWLVAAVSLWRAVRRSPRRMARRSVRDRPDAFGRNREEVSDRGITWIAADGAEAFTPWSVLTSFRESADYFYVYDKRGTVRGSLPKRGLPSPDRVPALRDYLIRAITDCSRA